MPNSPFENEDKDQEEFWAGKPSIKKLTENLAPLIASRQGTQDASSKMQSLPDSIKSSPFSMALAQTLLEDHPNMSAENLAETLLGI